MDYVFKVFLLFVWLIIAVILANALGPLGWIISFCLLIFLWKVFNKTKF